MILARYAQARPGMKTITLFGLFVFGALTVFGCNTVDNTVDCDGICRRYADCFDKSYDVSQCTSRCLDSVDNEGYHTQADACVSCIDDKSCTSATFNCATQCKGIVP